MPCAIGLKFSQVLMLCLEVLLALDNLYVSLLLYLASQAGILRGRMEVHERKRDFGRKESSISLKNSYNSLFGNLVNEAFLFL